MILDGNPHGHDIKVNEEISDSLELYPTDQEGPYQIL